MIETDNNQLYQLHKPTEEHIMQTSLMQMFLACTDFPQKSLFRGKFDINCTWLYRLDKVDKCTFKTRIIVTFVTKLFLVVKVTTTAY